MPRTYFGGYPDFGCASMTALGCFGVSHARQRLFTFVFWLCVRACCFWCMIGTDNCPFIGTNRVPSSADCCIRPPPSGWVFGETQTVATVNLDHVATVLETAIANGNFTALCVSKGFDTFDVVTTFFTEALVSDRFIVEGIIHLLSPLTPETFSNYLEPHRNYRNFFADVLAQLLDLTSSNQIVIDSIQNDTSAVADTGDAEFRNYRRRLAGRNSIKVLFRIDLGSVGSFFEENFRVTPKSARSSVSYLQYLQFAERNTGKACEAGYMGHDCTQRTCAYGLSIYSSMFVELDRLHVPGFHNLNGPESTGAEHTYSECSDAGECNRLTGECECYPPFTGKACRRSGCPEDCNGNGQCLPSSFADGVRPSAVDVIGLSTQHWDKYKQHKCVCDRGWEGLTCSKKICPRGDYVMTILPNFEEELSGCDVQEIVFENFTVGEMFTLSFENFERDSKKTHPIEFSGNASGMARAIKLALQALPNEILPSVTVLAGNLSNSDVRVRVVFSDPHNSGLQNLLECNTVAPSGFCSAGMQPMMLPGTGKSGCLVQHLLAVDELNENIECGGRGHCDRNKGICMCNVGTYGEACEMTTDYL